jgi:hypothetical protein
MIVLDVSRIKFVDHKGKSHCLKIPELHITKSKLEELRAHILLTYKEVYFTHTELYLLPKKFDFGQILQDENGMIYMWIGDNRTTKIKTKKKTTRYDKN